MRIQQTAMIYGSSYAYPIITHAFVLINYICNSWICFSFYRNGDAQTVLIVKDTEGSVYGGYASQPWERHSDFYGDMKSFLFKLYPQASIFRPTGANKNLQWVCLALFETSSLFYFLHFMSYYSSRVL